MTNLTHSSFLCVYFNSLHVSNNFVLIIRRINCIYTTFMMHSQKNIKLLTVLFTVGTEQNMQPNPLVFCNYFDVIAKCGY